jgi:hypothetical protein
METLPLICWVVVCSGFMNCSEHRYEVTSAAHCSRKVQEHNGWISKAQGHLLPITTKERYEIECGKGGIDCKDK